jgi:hypothetical protein
VDQVKTEGGYFTETLRSGQLIFTLKVKVYAPVDMNKDVVKGTWFISSATKIDDPNSFTEMFGCRWYKNQIYAECASAMSPQNLQDWHGISN